MAMTLRPFFMEDLLEKWRTKAKFNLGESGHRPRTLDDVLRLTGYEPARFLEYVLGPTVLRDAPNRGSSRLRELVARMHPGAEPENVLITTGSSEALFLYFHIKKYSKIALIVPAFQALYEVPRSLGAQIVGLPVTFDIHGNPKKQWELWEQVLRSERPNCLVFNHPHNPTGLVFSASELKKLKDICLELEIAILGDEHYRFLAEEDMSLGPTLYQNDGQTTVTGSFIKCTGTPGLRIGWCVGPVETIDQMRAMKDYTTHTVCPLVEKITEVVLQNISCELFRNVHAEWLQNRVQLTKWLGQSGRSWAGTSPSGGLVSCLFPRDCDTDIEFKNLMEKLLAAGVFLLPLSTMEHPWPAFIPPTKHADLFRVGFRIGLGSEPASFEQALWVLQSV